MTGAELGLGLAGAGVAVGVGGVGYAGLRRKGLHLSREVTRAHILLALDKRIPDATIASVLGVERTAIWRTRSAYGEKGLEYAVHDVAQRVEAE